MKSRAVIDADAVLTDELGYTLFQSGRWGLPPEIEGDVWMLLSMCEDVADRLAKWRHPSRE